MLCSICVITFFPSLCWHEITACNEDEEDWEGDNFPSSKLNVEGEGFVQEQYDSKEAELEDYLIADDPAYHSDDFSGPEFD